MDTPGTTANAPLTASTTNTSMQPTMRACNAPSGALNVLLPAAPAVLAATLLIQVPKSARSLVRTASRETHPQTNASSAKRAAKSVLVGTSISAQSATVD